MHEGSYNMNVLMECKMVFAISLMALLPLMSTRVVAQDVSETTTRVKKIVFSSDRNGNDDIFMINQDGSDLVQLTDDLAGDRFPAISPDGTTIVFASERSGNWDIWIMGVDGEVIGGAAEQITSFATEETMPAWFPNGKEIAFVSTLAATSRDIYTMKLDGSKLQRVTFQPFNEQGPQVSPDGEEIVYVSDKFGNRDLWLVKYLQTKNKWGKKRRLTCEVEDEAGPSWHPDKSDPGRRIVYHAFRTGRHGIGKSHIFAMNTVACSCDDQGLPPCSTKQLTKGPAFDKQPVYSPNGKKIAFASDRLGTSDIWRMKADGARQGVLRADPGFDVHPHWGRIAIPMQ